MSGNNRHDNHHRSDDNHDDSPSSSPSPSLGLSSESEPLCEGDTKVIYNILPAPLSEDIFERVRDEVRWQRMSHQGGEVPRLVAVQGDVNDNDGDDTSIPVYRHPADESPPLRPFTPAVAEIKRHVEARLGHPLNHALIQLYRGGADYISEHSDKTLDIARDSYIANVSLGAERVMVLRTKRKPKQPWAKKTGGEAEAGAEAEGGDLKRQIQRARLPHNSLFQMGLATNRSWLHGIRADRRADRDKSAEELAYGGARVSLTFRLIGTFLNRLDEEDEGKGEGAEEERKKPLLIWGQGATAKTRALARPVTNGATPAAVAMLRAFGRENQLAAADFDWDAAYGAGFDVLHISASPRLFLNLDSSAGTATAVTNMRVQLMLAELGVGYARGSVGSGSGSGSGLGDGGGGDGDENPLIKFVDNDPDRTTVQGGAAIMLYLDRVYGSKRKDKYKSNNGNQDLPPAGSAADVDADDLTGLAQNADKESSRFQEALSLLDRYRAHAATAAAGGTPEPTDDGKKPSSSALAATIRDDLLKSWAEYAATAEAEAEAAAQETRRQETRGIVGVAGYIAGSGPAMTIADFAFWPVLHSMLVAFGTGIAAAAGRSDGDEDGDGDGDGALLRYYERIKGRDSTRRVLAAGGGGGGGAAAAAATSS
ncbi:hypothetical protein SLS62_003083 [Diatrype stigma]|uniref:Fe2OG dioxygenase domain-containing protein n=1 Tax=Diatrype stigma TaxID=117547 RepID=A0AAN9YUN7_9PEZI